jgi:pimeloyl-ACP methyl ester carboxylesterase
MERNKIILRLVVIVALRLLFGPLSMAQEQPTKATFVRLGPGVPGVLYEPVAPGEKSQIGIFVMHSGGDYLTHSSCTELSKRGYRVLCANNTTSKAGTSDDGSMDRMLLDAKLGVAYLRKYSGIRKVVLFGHSGGGALMSSYQNIAENGLKACQGPEKILKCSDSLAGLPAADGLMLIDSNWGLAEMMLFSVDPSVISQENGQMLDPDLDLFNPKNGFSPAGSNYSDEFIHKFLSAEGQRNNQLIKAALGRLELIKAGKGNFADDEPFIAAGANFRGDNNRLFAQDIKLMSHTRKDWPLLRPDGSIVTQVIHSVRVPQNTISLTSSFEKGALKTSIRNFLSTYAIRVTGDYGYDEDSVHGIDWTSSYSSPPGNVEGITVPLLTMGMTGHWEYLAAETIFDHARSADKTLVFVEGATHLYTTCTACEKYPGQFGNTQKTTYDYVDSWLSKTGRFF